MGYVIDLTGKKFGRWIAIECVGRNSYGGAMWKCVCDCGTERVVDGRSLRNGTSTSCGCKRKEWIEKHGGDVHRTHGGRNDRLYGIWHGMKDRCYNTNSKFYYRYGGRGISVCDEWRDDYNAFKKWAYENGFNENAPEKGCTIDRFDNDKGYCPENCAWRTMEEQCNNRSNNRIIEYDNESHTLSEWSRITGLHRTVISNRIDKYGWSVEEALTTPVKPKNIL